MNEFQKSLAYLALFIAIIFVLKACFPAVAPSGARTKYFCEDHVMAMSLNVDIMDGFDNIVYTVSGEFFSAFEDNLTMCDAKGNVIRTMSDSYNLISQNDHTIIDGEQVLYVCAGEFSLFGNAYQVFTNDGNQIATMSFNHLDTKGTLKNMDGEIIARYDSGLIDTDYIVSIFDGCGIDDASILIMFASYLSDVKADS